MKNKKTTIW